MRASSKDRLEAFEVQGGWVCSRETGWAWGQRCRQRLCEVNEFSLIQSRIGSHRMGFQQTSHWPSFDFFFFKGDLSSVQCSYLLFSLIWFIYIFLFKI